MTNIVLKSLRVKNFGPFADEVVFTTATDRAKKEFMENDFIPQNNKEFGYNRFDFLYLQDDMDENDLITMTSDKIKNFFKENE